MKKTKHKIYPEIQEDCDTADAYYSFIDLHGEQNDIIMNECSDGYSIDYTHFIDGDEHDGGQLEDTTFPQLIVKLLELMKYILVQSLRNHMR